MTKDITITLTQFGQSTQITLQNGISGQMIAIDQDMDHVELSLRDLRVALKTLESLGRREEIDET